VFPIATDLESVLLDGLDRGEIELDRLIVVEEAPTHPGELIFQPLKGAENLFYSRYRDWVSYQLVLSELFNLPTFVQQLQTDGYQVVFGPNCEKIFTDYVRWAEPLKVQGYDLYGFQQFALRRALERRDFFFNFATGAGKSFIQAVAAKDMFARNTLDVVIACTTPGAKINQARFYESAGLDVVVNDGSKARRTKVYGERHQVYVCNYEKLWVDFPALQQLCVGRRVLFAFDEVIKIITGDSLKKNKARRAFERLWPDCHPNTKVWPMSASVVSGNPLRYFDVFSIADEVNPLGTERAFTTRYADKIETIELRTTTGKKFPLTNITWNHTRLQEIRHRVGDRTQVARKTDPGIAHLFKDMQTIVEPIQMSPGQRKLAEAIIDEAQEAYGRGETMKPFYDLLRTTAVTPLALRHTTYEVGQQLAAEFGETLDSIANAKLDRLNEMLAELREEGSQCLVFTHWTNLGLHLIKDAIEVPHVVHYGTGQSAKDRQAAQDTFRANPDITCFLTSDAGKEGLNMQCARVVIQLDPTYQYDDTYQRASRIHRADSYLDGLTNIVYITEDSVEERVWKTNLAGRLIGEAVQGSVESLNFGADLTWADRERAQRSEADNLMWMIFGAEI
jgi:hypothetical protein